MFVGVKLLKGWQEKIWYRVPEELIPKISIGTLLEVPLRNKSYPAIILEINVQNPCASRIKMETLTSIHTIPFDPTYHAFVTTIHQLYFLPSHYNYQRLRIFFSDKKKNTQKIELLTESVIKPDAIIPTDEQKKAINQISHAFTQKEYTPHLLHGLTGSGKTIVYYTLIKQMLIDKKSIIFLVPEVGLAVRFTQIFKTFLGTDFTVYSFHSANTENEKKNLWRGLCQQQPMLIIGVHLPIIMPIENLGLIIVDEEHEQGYQEKKHPKFQTKELALLRAKMYKIPIILGSATPSIQTFFLAEKENWPIITLKERYNKGQLPTIEQVSLLTREKRSCFWLSNRLITLIKDRLAKKEQIILFINRRGYSFFAHCKLCGFIFQCRHCSVSLTVHQENDRKYLSCHYCSFNRPLPQTCPTCNAPEKELLTKGIGTQKLLETLTQLFPAARIARADLDTTKKKVSWQKTVDAMDAGEIDILVGTQSITKGYHFPQVTLVGVIWADLHLHIPLFSAAERTLQQLLQVSGRAGRAGQESMVLVQYMHHAELFNFLHEEDYYQFYLHEKEARKQANYPPWCRLISLELYHKQPSIIDEEAEWCVEFLEKYVETLKLDIQILGPAKPLVYKVKNIEVRQIFIKTQNFQIVYPIIKKLLSYDLESKIQICPTQG